MFYITISNGLLKDDHRKRMGVSVWEFMWCMDKVTRIDEDGTGWVLGGKPIKITEIMRDLGISRPIVIKNLQTLEKEGYITKLRTPYGTVLKVAKAKKIFQKKDSGSDVSEPRRQKSQNRDISGNGTETSNKIIHKDKTIDNVSQNGKLPLTEAISTQTQPKKAKIPKEYSSTFKVELSFLETCRKELGIEPLKSAQGRSMIKRALGRISEEQCYDKIQDWFSKSRPEQELMRITHCFSDNEINGYLVAYGK